MKVEVPLFANSSYHLRRSSYAQHLVILVSNIYVAGKDI